MDNKFKIGKCYMLNNDYFTLSHNKTLKSGVLIIRIINTNDPYKDYYGYEIVKGGRDIREVFQSFRRFHKESILAEYLIPIHKLQEDLYI